MYSTGDTPIFVSPISAGNVPDLSAGVLIPSIEMAIPDYVTLTVTVQGTGFSCRNGDPAPLSGDAVFISLDNGKTWRAAHGPVREFRYQYLGDPVLYKAGSDSQVSILADVL